MNTWGLRYQSPGSEEEHGVMKVRSPCRRGGPIARCHANRPGGWGGRRGEAERRGRRQNNTGPADDTIPGWDLSRVRTGGRLSLGDNALRLYSTESMGLSGMRLLSF